MGATAAAAPHDTETSGAPRDAKPSLLPDPGYDLGAVIGQGGMGEVVSARDRRIGRDVAIKRMRAPAPTDTQTNRFLREARVQASLDHPAIVPVHELGPVITAGCLFGMTANPWFRDRRYAVYLWLVIAFATPIVLEMLGVFERTARRELRSQAWHLHQLLPKIAPDVQ
jgi:serine/threonine protein kinase